MYKHREADLTRPDNLTDLQKAILLLAQAEDSKGYGIGRRFLPKATEFHHAGLVLLIFGRSGSISDWKLTQAGKDWRP